jgi:hypothetical protein
MYDVAKTLYLALEKVCGEQDERTATAKATHVDEVEELTRSLESQIEELKVSNRG